LSRGIDTPRHPWYYAVAETSPPTYSAPFLARWFLPPQRALFYAQKRRTRRASSLTLYAATGSQTWLADNPAEYDEAMYHDGRDAVKQNRVKKLVDTGTGFW